jgi:hypothetical protein
MPCSDAVDVKCEGAACVLRTRQRGLLVRAMVSNALLSIAMRGQFDSQDMRRGVAALRLLVKPAEPEACDDDHVGVYLMCLLRRGNSALSDRGMSLTSTG